MSTASIQVSFSILGIPDSSNPAIPLNQKRDGTIDFVDANNVTRSINAGFSYDSINGVFTTQITAAVPAGIYLPKINIKGYLHKALPLITISQNTAVPSNYSTNLISGDADGDNTLDILDFQKLISCYNKTVASNPECAPADFNDDGNIDPVDFNIFLREFSSQQGA